jgi:hypothetical protein
MGTKFLARASLFTRQKLHAATEKSAVGVFPPKRRTLRSLSGADKGSGLLGWFAVAISK